MLQVTIRGSDNIEVTLQKLSGALDTTKILDEAGAFLFNRIRTRYLAQVDPDGNTWVESRAAVRRRARGIGGGTLFDTGRLFRSLQLSTVGDKERTISTDVPYAPKHNLGLDGNLKRVFLGFGDEDASLVTRLIAKRIRTAVA